MNASDNEPPSRWFDYSDQNSDPGLEAWRCADHLWQTQGKERADRSSDFLALYFGDTRYSLNAYRSNSWVSQFEAPSLNMVQAFTDTLVAMIIRQKVRPYFLTVKGEWEQRERAEGMTFATEAIFREVGLYDDLAVDLGFDGHLFDFGCIKWLPDYANERVIGARVMPWAVLIPQREQRLQMPRQFFEVDTIDRGVLMARQPDTAEGRAARDKIKAAPSAPWDADRDCGPDTDGNVADLIQYAECYHLPSGRVDRKRPEAWGRTESGKRCTPNHDGRRMLVLGRGGDGMGANSNVIEDDPWPYEYPPHAFYRPFKKPNQFGSRSVPESIYVAQLAAHRMNQRVDAIMNLHARPLLYLWKQARVNTDKINNAWASIIEGDMPAGQAMQYITPQSVPNEYLNRIDKIVAWCEKVLGLSEQTVQANRPPGIEHAPALQMLQDIESIRQHPRIRAWETMHVDSGRRVVDCLRMLAQRKKQEKRGKLTIIWGESKHMRKIDWGACDLEDSQFVIGRWPTNLLPSTPGAKLARLAEMAATGILTAAEARFVLASDYPDIEALLGDSNALVANIQNKLDLLIKGGDIDRAQPDSYLHLELAKTLVQERINAADKAGLPQEKLDLLIAWHEDIVDLIADAAAIANANATAGAVAPVDPNVAPAAPLPEVVPPMPAGEVAA